MMMMLPLCVCVQICAVLQERMRKKLQHNFHGQSNLKNYVALPACLCVLKAIERHNNSYAKHISRRVTLGGKKTGLVLLALFAKDVEELLAGTDFYV